MSQQLPAPATALPTMRDRTPLTTNCDKPSFPSIGLLSTFATRGEQQPVLLPNHWTIPCGAVSFSVNPAHSTTLPGDVAQCCANSCRTLQRVRRGRGHFLAERFHIYEKSSLRVPCGGIHTTNSHRPGFHTSGKPGLIRVEATVGKARHNRQESLAHSDYKKRLFFNDVYA